ncbi:uncharacterized protein TNCV_1917571 [Trichonephila clavipes]|uniref:Uncharacterized protein n=1 Tax=Trichonephila clavipes TaxID=2585209 RepID=A0A8X6W0X2_TRICX|nr:uncharacterized protein TNCV_1917571 [Trichonephila clavipes]
MSNNVSQLDVRNAITVTGIVRSCGHVGHSTANTDVFSINNSNSTLPWSTAPARFDCSPNELFNPPTEQKGFFRPTREASKMDCTDFSAFKRKKTPIFQKRIDQERISTLSKKIAQGNLTASSKRLISWFLLFKRDRTVKNSPSSTSQVLKGKGKKGEQSNPAGAVDQGSVEFELLMGKPVGGSTGGDQFHVRLAHSRKHGVPPKIKSQSQFLRGGEIFSDSVGLTWEHDILVLKTSSCLNNGSQVYDWRDLDEWRRVGSNLKSGTQTGVKILWI